MGLRRQRNRQTGLPVCNAIVWQCRRTAALCDRLKEEGLTENMHQNYLHYYQALFGNVKEEFTEEKINGRKIPRSVYSFYWDGRQVTRTNYYFSGEKALLVAGITVPEGEEGPGNLFGED